MTREEWGKAIEANPMAAYSQAFGGYWAEMLVEVPELTCGGLVRYILLGTPPGHFLEAVLSNDLMEAFGRADEDNRDRLFEICAFLHSAAPCGCYRSPKAVEDWIAQGGAMALLEQEESQ